MKTLKAIRKFIKWVLLSTVIFVIIFIYMVINHPYAMMNFFGGPSQEQVDKEWNQPITPSVCYTADCR
jgi:antibiotic biosynthesis monooxygenase (ABM) superfamily enzyme